MPKNRFKDNMLEDFYLMYNSDGNVVKVYTVTCKICNVSFEGKDIINCRGMFIRHFLKTHSDWT